MSNCKREGNFKRLEMHICFYCFCKFFPGKSDTCEICNWKKCSNGHCGCDVSKETKIVLDKFYDLFCDSKNKYSSETKNALYFMLKSYMENCL